MTTDDLQKQNAELIGELSRVKAERDAVRLCFAEASHNAGPAFVAHETLNELRAANVRLAEELDKATRFCICAYCKAEIPKDADAIMLHMQECEKHPLGDALRAEVELKKQLAECESLWRSEAERFDKENAALVKERGEAKALIDQREEELRSMMPLHSPDGPTQTCPFCGQNHRKVEHREVSWRHNEGSTHRLVVTCQDCGAAGPAFGHMSMSNDKVAYQYWNDRVGKVFADRDALAAQVAGMRQVLSDYITYCRLCGGKGFYVLNQQHPPFQEQCPECHGARVALALSTEPKSEGEKK